jgi:hypothetical protein
MSRLKGLAHANNRLNEAIKEINGVTRAGLIRGAIIIIRDCEKGNPKTPLDTGNLRASRFVVSSDGAELGDGASFKGEEQSKMASDHSSVVSDMKAETKLNVLNSKQVVMIGYSAYYATYVHEKITRNQLALTFSRPGSGPKWLQASVLRNKDKIIKVIKKEAKKAGF